MLTTHLVIRGKINPGAVESALVLFAKHGEPVPILHPRGHAEQSLGLGEVAARWDTALIPELHVEALVLHTVALQPQGGGFGAGVGSVAERVPGGVWVSGGKIESRFF